VYFLKLHEMIQLSIGCWKIEVYCSWQLQREAIRFRDRKLATFQLQAMKRTASHHVML
jgi:hypothetical protein